MTKRGQPSAYRGGSDHGSERSETNSNHFQPRPGNPRGRGRGNARGGGQTRRRNGPWQPGTFEPTNTFPPGRDGQNPPMSPVHHPLYYIQDDTNMMRSFPTHIPPERPFPSHTLAARPPLMHPPNPMPYGIPPWHQQLGPNPCNLEQQYNAVPFDYSNIGPAPVPDKYNRVRPQSWDKNQTRNQPRPCDSRKNTVDKKQTNKYPAAHMKAGNSQRKNKNTQPLNNNNTPSQSQNVNKNTQPQNNKNVQKNKKDKLKMSTNDRVEPESKKKSAHENELDETQSSLEKLRISDKDPLQDPRKDEIPDDKRSVLKMKDDQMRPPVSTERKLTLINQSAAKSVAVPMNFGIELLDSVTHNNIELVADQGAVIRANSAILSLNSPVIHHMATTLELNRIDMEEFSEQSVRYFVEAAYTGKLPAVPGDMFRDLNKIAHVFKVTWLQVSCFVMFSEFTCAIPEILPSYEDFLFVFEEAAYVLSKIKQRNFVDVALGKITSSDSRQMFIEKYLVDIGTLSDYHLDMVIELAGANVDLIVQPLKEQLLKQLGVEGTLISDECKYLLENCDLSPCRRDSTDLFEQLFDVLQELANGSNEDMKWVLQLHRKSANKPEVSPRPTSSLDEGSKRQTGENESEDQVNDQKPGNSGKSPNSEKKSIWFWQK